MIKGAIFDMDGTLLDSMSLWDKMGEDYLCSLGYEPRTDVNEIFKSLSLYDAACFFKRNYGVTLSADEIVESIDGIAEDFYKNRAELKNGAGDFLRKLGEKGVKMCIASSTDRHLVEMALERCGVLRCFSRIFTCTEVGSGKSEPTVYREAMKYMGTDRSDTVVVEDAYFAIKTAKKDGFRVAAVYDRHQPNQEGILSLSDHYMNDLSDFEGFWDFASAGGRS